MKLLICELCKEPIGPGEEWEVSSADGKPRHKGRCPKDELPDWDYTRPSDTAH